MKKIKNKINVVDIEFKKKIFHCIKCCSSKFLKNLHTHRQRHKEKDEKILL